MERSSKTSEESKTPRITTDNLIVEIMATRSGKTLLAREIGQHLDNIYNRQASPKSISKRLILLTDQYPLLNRKPTDNDEKARFNCRYTYKWGHYT